MNRPKVEEFEFLEEYAETLEIYCDQLEKALDKACEELHSNSAWCHYGKMSKKCGLSKEECISHQ